MRILLFTLLSLLLPISLVEAQNATGVYDTDFKEMTIQQDGSKFTGTYKWADGRLDGTISGHTASGWWYQSNGKGKFVFDFNSDFSAFTGKWGYNDATPSGQWNGRRTGGASAPASAPTPAPAPAPAMVSLGTYDTDFNEMTIQREGNKITGTYKWSDGRIEGTISGHTVTGWWYQSNGKGKFVFEFNSDFSAFTGKWGRNDATPSGQWNGKRK